MRIAGQKDRARARLGGRAACGLAVSAAWLLPSGASAYRTFADDPAVGRAARWGQHELSWELDISSAASDVEIAGVTAAAHRAWTTIAAAECSPLSFVHQGLTSSPAAPHDRRNSVSIVSRGWSERGFAADRAAITDVEVQVGEDGFARIVEADIYLNFDLFRFGGADGELDLETVLLHEGAHAWLGLLHNCELDGAGGAPLCSEVASATDSAVYPLYSDGAGTSLGVDDIAGICAIFGACEPACPMGSRCALGVCEPEPCESEECLGCVTDCGATSCSTDDDCGTGAACGVVGAATDFCVPRGSDGTTCTGAADCASGLCLTSARVGSYCTQTCAADTECGANQYCAAVDGRQVCAPRVAGSCSASPGPTPFAPYLLGLPLFLFWRRRRHE